ncbi:gp16 family protein [Acinetobacter pollinis]|uniref:gp16 family protein n=1 Tax=Acinetobacter pollinis TaxID=2605270 RepID=UPI0018A2E25B|nr:regulatory protein GemA [Acinetobacter pollinis]MBF7689599.1 regulatory protein GemA [Acinetobacter pollinis]MBF7698218.1 regulatory protein GemA [Acinetobacter pollinis]
MKKPTRNQRLATIHVAKKSLGLDDDTYRDLLEQVTGERSAKHLNDDQLIKVLKHFEHLGFAKKDFGQKPDVAFSKQNLINKIEAILADHKLHWNYAKGIAKKMFNKEALEFCSVNELYRIVAALEYKKKRVSHAIQFNQQTS